jgi:hypothetical protein
MGVHGLSDDVLAIIFEDESLKATFCEPENLITIISTCKQWRDAALSTSSLWKFVTIRPRSPLDDLLWLTEERIRYWLHNSGTTGPLDIEIRWAGRTNHLEYRLFSRKVVARLQGVMLLLLAEQQRWRNVVFQRLPFEIFTHLETLAQDSFIGGYSAFPGIQNLTIEPGSGLFQNLTSWATPNLRSISICGSLLKTDAWNKFVENSPLLENIELHFIQWEGGVRDLGTKYPLVKRFVYTTIIKNSEDARQNEAEILYWMLRSSSILDKLEIREEEPDLAIDDEYEDIALFAGDSGEWFSSQSPLHSVKNVRISLGHHRTEAVDVYVQHLHNFVSLFPNMTEFALIRDPIDDWEALDSEDMDYAAGIFTEQVHEACITLPNLKTLTLDNVPIRQQDFVEMVKALADPRRAIDSNLPPKPPGLVLYFSGKVNVPPEDTFDFISAEELRELVEAEVPGFDMRII